MKFKIEQIALAINMHRESEALALLTLMGITEWANDTVVANGRALQYTDSQNSADLSFNYTALNDAKELELLRYREGKNWLMFDAQPRVSHLGMHVTAEELEQWRATLTEFGLGVVQEVHTVSHTNPVIAGKRWYNYVIFGATQLIGTDIKFIVRMDAPKPA
jgi:hypothetical protein